MKFLFAFSALLLLASHIDCDEASPDHIREKHFVFKKANAKLMLPTLKPEPVLATSSFCALKPCLNGGTCVSLSNGGQCLCTPNHTGKYCEKSIFNLLI